MKKENRQNRGEGVPEKVASIAMDTAKVVGKLGIDATLAGGGAVARKIKKHPKETALAAIVLMAALQEGHKPEEGVNFDEHDVTASVGEDDWTADITKFANIAIDNSKGETVYALIKHILEEDETFQILSSDRKSEIIDSMIFITREMNPTQDLDNFPSLIGDEIMFPTEFSWRPREEEVLKGKGYRKLQAYARVDGYDVRRRDHGDIYNEVKNLTVLMPPGGDGFMLDRKGSEDSEAMLFADVAQSINNIGQVFSAMEIGPAEQDGWKFVITDMLRDPETQGRRKSLAKGSTHSTGRSFDISDGRWITPDGEEITWSKFDENGRGVGKSKYAGLIDSELRPAFEQTALEHGWILYKEAGHWHAYVPSEISVDLSDEWKQYADSQEHLEKHKNNEEEFESESGLPISNIGKVLLSDYAQNVSERVPYSQLKIERDATKRKLKGRSFISELTRKGPYYNEIIDQMNRAQPEDFKKLGYLESTTISNKRRSMTDLEKVWNYKVDKKLNAGEKKYGRYVESRVGKLDHEHDFATWYKELSVLRVEMYNNAEAFTRDRTPEGIETCREMLKALTPEVMLAVIHAEFLSELSGETFADIAPRLFDGYNIMQGPALNDRLFSAGPAQLIRSTFVSILGYYGRDIAKLQKDMGVFKSVVIPQKVNGKYRTKDIAEAMVLDPESVAFHSYLSVVYHMEGAFSLLMSDKRFEKSWSKASEEEKMQFMATSAPMFNNAGRGGAKKISGKLLANMGGRSIEYIAKHVQNIKSKRTAKRSAKAGLSTINELIERGKEG